MKIRKENVEKGKTAILTPEESNHLIGKYFRGVKRFSFTIAETNGRLLPCFLVQTPLREDEDGGLWWKAGVDCVDTHCFIRIKLRNGRIVLPLCLIDPFSRKIASIIAETTKVKKYNEKEATILIGNEDGEVYPVIFSAESLCVSLVTSELFPPSFFRERLSRHCPLCRKLMKEREGM